VPFEFFSFCSYLVNDIEGCDSVFCFPGIFYIFLYTQGSVEMEHNALHYMNVLCDQFSLATENTKYIYYKRRN